MSNNGKSDSLIKLRERGFKVPLFFVAKPASTENELMSEINRILPNIDYFAIRSSVKNEDSKEKSYAGYFYSALGVSRAHAYQEFAKVVDSFEGKEGLVIIQEFIPSDKAGVIFSQVGEGNIVIDSTIGLCRPVVDGFECDEYVCDLNGLVIRKNISQEKSIELFKNDEIVCDKISTESLTNEEIDDIVGLSRKIQVIFGCPQDIEWCIKDNSLYVLQSRPITKDLKLNEGEHFFDSANIAESYSGVVLPLTFSYARFVYEQAYMDLLIMSGASKKSIYKYRYIFSSLLGHFQGRMYYDMNNWYKMTAFVPGYKRNKRNLEEMITSNVREEIDISIKPSLWLKVFYPFIVCIKILTSGSISKYFIRFVEGKISEVKKNNFQNLDYAECVSLFQELSNSLLHRWYITMENDFLVMTYLGILEKLVDKKTLQKIIAFHSTATKQVDAIANLSAKMQEDSVLWESIEREDVDEFKRVISEKSETERMLNAYLSGFGYRFANELKLESVGIEEDITKLFNVLKIYKNYKKSNRQTENTHIRLAFPKNIILSLVLKEFKKHASRREEFRLLRSNVFGVIRHLFKRMGEAFVQKEMIENKDDVFYLTLEEILSDDLSEKEFFKIKIKERKKEYSLYKKISAPVHFSTKSRNTMEVFDETLDSNRDQLLGNPSFPGMIKGRVKVFKDFFIPETIDFDILVASHTDPGWTSIIALSKGLIIEHGGLLSHASIVARELNIPTIIGVVNATDKLQDGQLVEMDGSTGIIKIIQ